MAFNIKTLWRIFFETARKWNADDPFRHGAIIAYYAIFSIPGLLMIIIWVAGAIFGEEAIQGQLNNYIGSFIGNEGAQSVEKMLVSARLDDDKLTFKLLGIGTLMFGATTLFLQLQKSLNEIWQVKAAPQNGLFKLLNDRATSLGLIVVIAFLLLVTLVVSTGLSVVAVWLETNFGDNLLVFIHIINFVISLGVASVLFAIMFKVLPDVDIQWRSVWVGAVVTATLFTIGKTLLGIYFRYSDPASSYGAASTVILIMLWVNYTCLILFFGAKLCNVLAHYRGHPVKPSEHAEWTAEYIVAQQLTGAKPLVMPDNKT